MPKSIRSITAMGVVLGVTLATGSALADWRDYSRPSRPPTRAVPEISGSQAGAALTLVLGGVAVVLGRRRRKAA